MLKIITNPHPILRKKAKEISVEEIPNLQKFFNNMEKTMLNKDGIGLAANQVDVLKRIIIVNTKDGPLAIINPKISRKSFRKEEAEEGCLSVPNVFGYVKRHKHIMVSGLDRQANKLKIKAKGLFARVIQHEVDHLDGILFIDKAKKYLKGQKQDGQKNL